jgi:hypothetical protein
MGDLKPMVLIEGNHVMPGRGRFYDNLPIPPRFCVCHEMLEQASADPVASHMSYHRHPDNLSNRR